MTKEQSLPQSGRQSLADSAPPAYIPSYDRTLNISEKLDRATEPCHVHGASPTTHIDALLQTPSAKVAMRALSTALADAVDENHCTKCATDSAASALTIFARDLRAAKKNGQWTREDKKALKTETKWLFKGMKHDVKDLWKRSSVDATQE